MKALLYPEFGRLEIADVPVPTPARGEVLVQVAAVGLCGSELEAFRSRSLRRQPPLVMGHEFCGTVVAEGEGLNGEYLGKKFVCNALVPCLDCVECRHGDTHICARRQIFGMNRLGAFADYCAVPVHVLLPWPDTLSAEEACLAEPLGNGVHMVNLTRHLRADNVLVMGAGPIGLMAMQAFKALRSSRIAIADLNSTRAKVGSQVGAERAINPKEEDVAEVGRAMTEGQGFDLVIDAVGSPVTKRQSIGALRPGGSAVWIGLHSDDATFSTYALTLAEKAVIGSYGARQDELQQAIDLLNSKQVQTSPWVTLFPLEEGVDAFERMLAAEAADIKAVLIPHPSGAELPR